MARLGVLAVALRHVEHHGRPRLCRLRLGRHSKAPAASAPEMQKDSNTTRKKSWFRKAIKEAVQLAAPTLPGCKFRLHALTTPLSWTVPNGPAKRATLTCIRRQRVSNRSQ